MRIPLPPTCLAACAALALLAGCGGSEKKPCGTPGPDWVAYHALRGGKYEIRAVARDGGCDVQVAEGPTGKTNPSMSLAAGLSAWWTSEAGQTQLVVAGLDGSSPRVLDVGTLVAARPELSPDGKYLAFDGKTAALQPDIHVVPVAGGAPVVLAQDPALDQLPSWSADGKALVFGSNRSGGYQIWKVDADGTGLVQLTTDDTAVFQCGAKACAPSGKAALSPDGKTLAFTRTRPDGTGSIVLRDLATGAERALADAVELEPSWSPDGKALAVASSIFGGDFEIVVRSVATGEVLARLTHSTGVDGAPFFAR